MFGEMFVRYERKASAFHETTKTSDRGCGPTGCDLTHSSLLETCLTLGFEAEMPTLCALLGSVIHEVDYL